jgi:hypothetical protein
MAGRIAFSAPGRVMRSMKKLRCLDGLRGPCEYGFKKRRDLPRERDDAFILRFQSAWRVRDARHQSTQKNSAATGIDRSGEPRALPAGSGSRPFICQIWAAYGKHSRIARLPPRDVSPFLTSPCPAHCRDASGARRYSPPARPLAGHFDRAAGLAG